MRYMDIRTDISAGISQDAQRKLEQLERLLDSYGSVAIGFSGGVDSTFLAAVCARCMPGRTLLVHLDTPLIGTPEQESFEQGARELGLPIAAVTIHPLDEPTIASNPADRCYHCKLVGFTHIVRVAHEWGMAVVVDGSNADDADDYRPGMQAIRELNVQSPLMETGWHKDEEREVLRAWGMPVWNLPAGACLATRIPCGEALTGQKLQTVRLCEDYLHGLGLKQVRVRLEGRRAHVAAAQDDLMRLTHLGGTECPDGGVELPPQVVEEFLRFGASAVDPVARPYVHGAMSKPAVEH